MYFLPFYAILRSIPDKVGGIVIMGGAIVMLLIFPLINIAETRSPLFRPVYKFFVMIFLANFLLLGYLGQSSTDYPFSIIGQLSTLYYFFFLTVIVSGLGPVEKFLTTKGNS